MTQTTPMDSYAEAIPIDELVELARVNIDKCATQSTQAIRQCAENIVRLKLCPCASSIDAIVDAVVTEYLRQLAR